MADDLSVESEGAVFQSGQRLICPECGAEIEVVSPSPIHPPRQVFRCCGHDMLPTTPAEA